MRFEYEFALPVPVALAWPVLLDHEVVDECLPDGEVTCTGADEVSGKLRIRVGRNAVTYTGTARTVESDRAAAWLALSVDAREARGDGTITGTITAVGRDDGDGSVVSVTADLEVTGRAATFPAVALSDAGTRLFDRFAAALSERLPALAESREAPEPAELAEPPRPADAGTDRDRVDLVEPDHDEGARGRRIGALAAGIAAALLWLRRRRRRRAR